MGRDKPSFGQYDKELPQSPELLLEALHGLYFDRLQYFAYTFIHDQEKARDLVQDVFVSYWTKKDQLSAHPLQLRSFFYTSVKNACIKVLEHEQVVSKYLSRQDNQAVDDDTADRRIIRSEVLGEIYAAIETLPPVMRSISKMSYLEGLKNQQIAEELGISVDTVKVHKKRALKLLRNKLNPNSLLTLLLLIRHFH